MTNKEAIKCVEDVLNSDYHYDESLGYQLTSDDFEWLEKAKEALGKQIPKKPEKYAIDNNGYMIYDCECPNCKKSHRELYPFAYCGHCGQAIDWGDEK